MTQHSPKPETDAAAPESETGADRRDFLTTLTTLCMAGGLVAGYGTFFALAGRFLYPSRKDQAWLFVSTVDAIAPGESLSFESPGGVKVVIKRQADAANESAADQFIALSSTCPHLGCRVHWEGQNNRFFCPCHNGTFDPSGNPTGGPVLAANQHLPQYPLRVEGEMLFIEMPLGGVGAHEELIQRPSDVSATWDGANGDDQWA